MLPPDTPNNIGRYNDPDSYYEDREDIVLSNGDYLAHSVLICRECAALVWDSQQHNLFHDQLETVFDLVGRISGRGDGKVHLAPPTGSWTFLPATPPPVTRAHQLLEDQPNDPTATPSKTPYGYYPDER